VKCQGHKKVAEYEQAWLSIALKTSVGHAECQQVVHDYAVNILSLILFKISPNKVLILICLLLKNWFSIFCVSSVLTKLLISLILFLLYCALMEISPGYTSLQGKNLFIMKTYT
jgi:hypothetical protein